MFSYFSLRGFCIQHLAANDHFMKLRRVSQQATLLHGLEQMRKSNFFFSNKNFAFLLSFKD